MSILALMIAESMMAAVFGYLLLAFFAFTLSVYFDRHWLYNRPMWILFWAAMFGCAYSVGFHLRIVMDGGRVF